MARRAVTVTAPQTAPVLAIGGGLEGAENTSRETARWVPSMRSPDQVINGVKPMADARGRDMVWNDGYTQGGMTLHQDSIVGAEYRLNAQPNWRVLAKLTGAAYDEVWAEEFQTEVESWFTVLSNSPACWLDASRRNNLTWLVRQAVGGFFMTGEALATVEWLRETGRPIRTALQTIAPARLSNPHGVSDTRNLRNGVAMDDRGKPTGYWFRMAYPTEHYDNKSFDWKFVPAEKPWGRQQVVHIMDQRLPSQSRGIADMVSALKQMRMTKQFQEITLQNAVVNASFAAAIESELPTEIVQAMLGNVPNGASSNPFQSVMGQYLESLSGFLGGSKNLQIDGAKIPHLFPGTKLNTRTLGTPGGVGTDFEKSLLRYIAATLGVSYEELSRDYSNTSYSSARTSMTNTWKGMQARKAGVADKFASAAYALSLEEMMGEAVFPLPRGADPDNFYIPLAREAFANCGWIGASKGQIDELKETQAAILRIDSGLSTYEKECARFGDDFRETFAQRKREQTTLAKLGITVSLSATRSLGGKADEQDAEPAQEKER